MSDYKFTKDWFQWAPPVWSQLVPHLPARKNFLEIGSFEGRSTVWTVENMIEDGGEIICVDTWEGGEEHVAAGEDMNGAEQKFDHNREVIETKFPLRHVGKWKGKSVSLLALMIQDGKEYDFIYIDGSHIAKDVLTDACMSWPLLKKNGIMVFDDYLWGSPRDAIHRPKIAVDTFVDLFGEELSVVHMGYQFILRKTK